MTPNTRNMLAGGRLDRLGERRRTPGWVDSLLHDTNTRLLPVHKGRLLVAGGQNELHLAALTQQQSAGLLTVARELIVLGAIESTVYVAVSLEEITTDIADAWFAELRQAAPLMSPHDANLFAYARAMTHWHQTHRFCGVCGRRTASGDAGHIRSCTNSDCRHSVFPRIDPAVIVLVTNGQRCLLGRSAQWEPGRYSTIAGFVEPGESLEDAVRREVAEETGVAVTGVRYHSSQPWPFPQSLMLGFVADGTGDNIVLKDSELEDARWFSRDDIHAAVRDGTLKLSPKLSISRWLLDDWLGAKR